MTRRRQRDPFTGRSTEPALMADNDAGLFGPNSVTWKIHADPSMLLAGFRALLLQAVHPLVMAGFDANSSFRADPWGRLRRTSEWVDTVTFGTTQQADDAGRSLRGLHARLSGGIEPETGLSYRVDDPELLLWVHCTEVESFLSTYQRCGGGLSHSDQDRYVEEMRVSAELVGLDPQRVPQTLEEIEAYYRRLRPDLRVTAVARRNALWGFAPPMPMWVSLATPARPAWASLVAVSAAMLPRWARRLYGLPGLTITDIAATVAGRGMRQCVRTFPDAWIERPALHAARVRLAV